MVLQREYCSYHNVHRAQPAANTVTSSSFHIEGVLHGATATASPSTKKADHPYRNCQPGLATNRLISCGSGEELIDYYSSSLSSPVYSISTAIQPQKYSCIATLQSLSGHVISLAVSEDFLYCGDDGGNIQTWDRNDLNRCSSKFGNAKAVVQAVLVVGEKVITAHQDRKIRVWKLSKPHMMRQEQHRLVATLPTINNILTSCLFSKNYVQVRRHKTRLWIQHADRISVLAKGPDNVLYSGSWDKTLKVWRLWDFKCVESIAAHDDAINAMVVSSESHVYTASADTKIKVWKRLDVKRHSLIATLKGHKSAVNALAMSEGMLYSGSNDRSIVVWERDENNIIAGHMKKLCSLKGHRLAVLCLSAIGSLLCSGSADKTIRIWARGVDKAHSCIALLEGHKGAVKSISCASVDDDVKRTYVIYSGGFDHHVKVWTPLPSCAAVLQYPVRSSCSPQH